MTGTNHVGGSELTNTAPDAAPSSLIGILTGGVALPTLVFEVEDAVLSIVAANAPARGLVGHRQLGTALVDWIGSPAAAMIQSDVRRGRRDGNAHEWQWQLAGMDCRSWLICTHLGPVASQPIATGGQDPVDRRLISAYEAALAVGSDLSLETVLQRIVDVARHVVPARYAALGIADDQGRILQFITSGISPDERAAIGPLPRGHGLLGALIKEGKPLVIPNIAADPRSSGFPPNHPPMETLLGVPITLGDRVLGDLYLTEREAGTRFTQQDLNTVTVLAGHAASAIDRARLHADLRSAHKRAEEQRDRLRTILDNVPSAIIIATPPDGSIELANAAAHRLIFGEDDARPATLDHLSDFRLLEPEGLPLAHELRPGVRALSNLIVRNQQLLLERHDGEQIPVLTQATPLHDAQGSVTSAVIVFQDITKLREAEQLKDDFLSLISHEFRTPLTAIQGGAYLLAHQRTALDDATFQELLTDIVVESERLDRMLHNLLSLAGIMAGRLTAATEPLLLGPLARGVADEVGHRSPHHMFVHAFPTGLPPSEADADLLGQVLRNLLENSVKYSPTGGTIRVSATSDSTTVTISVTDEGAGIAPEHVPQVFERFRRPGADPTVRGMGLGLYLSRYLVEAQGGTIHAHSAGPGHGATFSVVLPIAHGWINTAEDIDG